MKDLNNKNNPQSQNGFSLLELLGVLIIIGILTAIVLPKINAGTSGAGAELKLQVADAVKACVQTIHARLGWGSNVLSNANYETGNNALDMCATGDIAIIAAQDDSFNANNTSGLADMVQVRTAATSGTPGAYFVGASQLTLSATQPTRQISVQYSNVSTEEICELKRKLEDQTAACAEGTADTTGPVQHSAAVNNLHTLTLLRQLSV